MPNVKLHLYGKGIPERGRKTGHLTALADSSEQAAEHAVAARKLLNLGVTLVFRNDNTMPQASSNVFSKGRMTEFKNILLIHPCDKKTIDLAAFGRVYLPGVNRP